VKWVILAFIFVLLPACPSIEKVDENDPALPLPLPSEAKFDIEWSSKSVIPTARGWLPPSACVLNNKIYVIGGAPDDVSSTNKVAAYDPTSDTWTEKQPIKVARWGHSSNVVDGKIYVIGGCTEEPTGKTVLAKMNVYDPITNTWTSLAPMPQARTYLSASAVGNKIYAVGGTKEAPWDGLRSIFEYDILTNTWRTKKDLITGRWAVSTCSSDNMIFCIGGLTGPMDKGQKTVEVYFPLKDSIVTATTMLYGRGSVSSCVFQKKVYSFGGTESAYPWNSMSNKTEAGSFE
jgi:N-acetylneuraminic acid mutarotase